MTNQEIVSKLWNLCNILRDDGITYHQYVTELTYILFLKMAKETKTEDAIPDCLPIWERIRKAVCERFIKGQVPILMNQRILRKSSNL